MLPIWKGQKADAGTALTKGSGVVYLSILLALTALSSGCSQGDLGKEGTLREVNNALTDGDCERAIELIEPLYNSSQSDNEVRMLRAASHGCKAGINFFEVLDEIANSTLIGTSFWEFSTRVFPATASDDKMEASWLAYDALMAATEPGASIPVSNYANPDDLYNLGSVKALQRTEESNVYMIEVAFAVMGTTQNLYGSPSAAYKQGVALPWNTSGAVTDEGCAYAGAVTSFFDSVAEIETGVDAATRAKLDLVLASFGAAVDQACEYGCQGLEADGVTPSADAASCNFGDCSGCPDTLRSRGVCMSDTNPRTKCAVAGLVRFVNDHPLLGWEGP